MSKLTKEELDRYELVPVTWQRIHDWKIETVYIQANPNAPVYGPYVVRDATTFSIANLDGSKPRMYPRDSGLLIPKQIAQIKEGKTYNPYQLATEGSSILGKTVSSRTTPEGRLDVIELTEDWGKRLNARISKLEKELFKLKEIQRKWWDLLAEANDLERNKL